VRLDETLIFKTRFERAYASYIRYFNIDGPIHMINCTFFLPQMLNPLHFLGRTLATPSCP
jgi:hypothetical protein